KLKFKNFMFQIEKSEKLILTAPKSLNISNFNKSDYFQVFNEINQDFILDLQNLKEYDSFTIYFIKEIIDFSEKNNLKYEIINQSDDFKSIFRKLSKYNKHQNIEKDNNFKSNIESVGKKSINFVNDIKQF